MKLSLAWIFDHVMGNWRDIDIEQFVQKFTLSIAEVDFCYKVIFDLEAFAIGKVTSITEHIGLAVPEWNKECVLPFREDVIIGDYCLIRKDKKNYHFATLTDLGSEKDGLVPIVWVPENHLKGEWKVQCDREDYVLTIDNKSLTHRPDLWSHRGFAREVATMLQLNMLPDENFLVQCIIKNYEKNTPSTAHNPVSLEIESPDKCIRLAGLYIADVNHKASLVNAARRLAIIDARPINALVDATNYVMYDIGQPLHAFDASRIQGDKLIARSARHGERITLLDGDTITLDPADCVISDSIQVLSLAGIMGGKASDIGATTTQLFLESGNFNPATIRKTSSHHKKRTEASARFEKGLDPNQNTIGLMRYLFLLNSWGISYTCANEIVSIGKLASEKKIEITAEFISKKIGTHVSIDTIRGTLQKLGFGLQERGSAFIITVPTYRLKDIQIKEDVVEEIARFIGYNTIPHHLPVRPMRSLNHRHVERVREIKNHCAFALRMHEIASYPLYDNEFLRTMGWQPKDAPVLSNPVSENWHELVTSLVPALLKAVKANIFLDESLNFFEWARTWKQKDNEVIEKTTLAMVRYRHNHDIDFYEAKAELETLFSLIDIPITWHKADSTLEPWFHPFQTAMLIYNDQAIGKAGKASHLLLEQIGISGDAFIVELDGGILEGYGRSQEQMMPLIKYPRTNLDISMLVPVTLSVTELEEVIVLADARVRDVYLIDYYEKPEWEGSRAVTIRYIVQDDFKTMTKQEIDEISHDVIEAVKRLGVTIR